MVAPLQSIITQPNELSNFIRYHPTGQQWALFSEICCVSIGACVFSFLLFWFALRVRLRHFTSSPLRDELRGKETLGFFHPNAAAAGGGERVLWCAIRAVQRDHPGLHCVVFTGDVDVTSAQMLAVAKSRFGIELCGDTIHFAYLHGRKWAEASSWPRVTLLLQSLGSMVLGWEALRVFCPDVMVDTTGYAFTFPLFSYVGWCELACYVHYPTISTDMLERVRVRETSFNNDGAVASSRVLSSAKFVYYKIFAGMYGWVGGFAQVALVNSSWTRGHIDKLWGIPDRTATVYPPCDTKTFAEIPLKRGALDFGGKLVLSLAQFRPEKDHPKQLRAFARFLKEAPQHASGQDRVRLLVAGGCRDDGDRSRLRALQDLCKELELRERPAEATENGDWDVGFCPNLPFPELLKLLGQASVGLHTMRDEHFGISVVEFMASGTVVLAHESAGPKMDIVKSYEGQRTGYLATDEASYTEALKEIFSLADEDRLQIAKTARLSIGERFSEKTFEDAFSARLVAKLRRNQQAIRGATGPHAE